MTVEKVQEAIRLSCRRSRCGLTSIVTSPPSPTKHIVPQTLVLRIALRRGARLARVAGGRGGAGSGAIARGVERRVGVAPVRQVLDRRDRIFRAGIDQFVRAELLGPRQPLR